MADTGFVYTLGSGGGGGGCAISTTYLVFSAVLILAPTPLYILRKNNIYLLLFQPAMNRLLLVVLGVAVAVLAGKLKG